MDSTTINQHHLPALLTCLLAPPWAQSLCTTASNFPLRTGTLLESVRTTCATAWIYLPLKPYLIISLSFQRLTFTRTPPLALHINYFLINLVFTQAQLSQRLLLGPLVRRLSTSRDIVSGSINIKQQNRDPSWETWLQWRVIVPRANGTQFRAGRL